MQKVVVKIVGCLIATGILIMSVVPILGPKVSAALPPYRYMGTVTSKDAQSNTITIQTDYEYGGTGPTPEWVPYSRSLAGVAPNEDGLSEINVGDYVEACSLGSPGEVWVTLAMMKSSTEEVVTDIYGDPIGTTSSWWFQDWEHDPPLLGSYKIEYNNTPDCSTFPGGGGCAWEAKYSDVTITKGSVEVDSHQLYPGQSYVYEGETYHIAVTFNSGQAYAYPECTDEPCYGPQAVSDFTIHISEAGEEVRFRGTAIERVGGESEWQYWVVEVQEVISGPSISGQIDVAVWGPVFCVFGYEDPSIEPGDSVEVFGRYVSEGAPWHPSSFVTLCGSEDYYIVKAEVPVVDWPMYMHDPQHTGYTEEPGPDTLGITWSYHYTEDLPWLYSSSPVIANGRVYVGADGGLLCLDAETGEQLWVNGEVSPSASSAPAVEDDKVYITTADERLACLDAHSGDFLWSVPMPVSCDNIGAPTAYGGMVYVKGHSDDAYVFAFDGEDGTALWNTHINRSFQTETVSISNGKVYAVGGSGSTLDNVLYCLNAYSGNILWEESLPLRNRWKYSPIISEGRLYIVKLHLREVDGYLEPDYYSLVCLNADTGDLIWDGEDLGRTFDSMGQPTLAYDRLYTALAEGEYHELQEEGCFSAQTGEPLWKIEVPYAWGYPVAAASEKIYLCGSTIAIWDAFAGDTISEFATVFEPSAPAVADGRVYANVMVEEEGEGQSYVYCLGEETTDTTPPTISNITESDSSINKQGCPEPTTVTIRADVTDDESGVAWVRLYYQPPGGSWTYATMSHESGSTYKVTIGPFSDTGTIYYYIKARDNAGIECDSSTYTVRVDSCVAPNGLDVSRLELGDILMANASGAISALVGIFGGYWGHTVIYAGGGEVVESTGSLPNPTTPGVRKVAIDATTVFTSSDWAVLSVDTTELYKTMAVLYAEQQEGKEYCISFYDKWTTECFYCSHLVWRAYYEAYTDLDSDWSLNECNEGGLWSSEVCDFLLASAVPPDDIFYDDDIVDEVYARRCPGPGGECKRAVLYLGSPADFYITDSYSRHVGVDPNTGQVVEEIPEVSYYSGPDAEPEYVVITDMEGDWDVEVIGTEAGLYTLVSEAVGLEERHQVEYVTKPTNPGQIDGYQLTYPTTPGEPIPLIPETVSLQTSWNLLSLPLVPTDTSIEAVFSSISGSYDLVYAYDGCDVADPWKRYDVNAPPYANDLTNLDEKMGIWIRGTDTSTLSVSGQVPTGTSIQLCEGWNLVGYPSTKTKAITDALSAIEGKYTLVYAYDALDTADPWKKYDVSAPPYANDLTEMHSGLGYWIKVSEDCVLTISN